jgi:hypothetical protein
MIFGDDGSSRSSFQAHEAIIDEIAERAQTEYVKRSLPPVEIKLFFTQHAIPKARVQSLTEWIVNAVESSLPEFLPVQRGLVGFVLLQSVQVFQEQQPGGLFGVVEFGGATSLFPKDVVDVFEGLFEHRGMELGDDCGCKGRFKAEKRGGPII